MATSRTVKTKQGNLDIWEHVTEHYNASDEKKYASKIFMKSTSRNVYKIHASAKDVDTYIEALDLPASPEQQV